MILSGQRTSKKYFYNILLLLVSSVVVAATGLLGVKFASFTSQISPVWPAAGIGVFLFCRYRSIGLLAVAIGSLAFNFLNDSTWALALIHSLIALIEAVIAVKIFNKIQKVDFELDFLKESLSYILSAFFAGFLCATLGCIILFIFGAFEKSDFVPSLQTWFMGDTLGIFLLFPLLNEFCQIENKTKFFNFFRFNSLDIFLVILTAVTSCVVFYFLLYTQVGSPFLFVVFPVLLSIVVFQGALAGYFYVLVFAALGYQSTSLENGVFALGSLNQNLLNFQLFLVALCLTSQILSAFKKHQIWKHTTLVLIFGWILAGTFFYIFYMQETKKSLLKYNQLVDQFVLKVEAKARESVTALQGGVSLFSASQSVERNEWEAYCRDLNLEKNIPGLRGMGVIFNIQRKNLESFIRQTRADGSADFTYKRVPNTKLPDQLRPEDDLFVITYIEPIFRNKQAVGLDIGSESNRRRAAELSRDTGEATSTEVIQLVQDGRSRPAMLMFLPLYKKNVKLDTRDDRRKNSIGWIYAPIVTEDFLDSIVSAEQFQDLKITVHQGPHSRSPIAIQSVDFDKGFERSQINKVIKITNQSFFTEFRQSKKLLVHVDTYSAWMGFAATIITLLLSSLMASVESLKLRADRLVEQKTKFLEESYNQISEQQLQLASSAKMAALGEMAGGIAHEINNPLTVIVTKTNLLVNQLSKESIDKDKMREGLRQIENTALRIAKIISGLRHFSRDGSKDNMDLVGFKAVVEDVLSLCRERLKSKQIELKLDHMHIDESMKFRGRGVQISQVLLNLISNSVDAIENLEDRWIEIKTEVHNSNVQLRITDSGAGIPESVQEKMMQPFFTTKEVGKGTGLGLSISRSIIQEHGGEFRYEEENKHTSFVIAIPLAQSS